MDGFPALRTWFLASRNGAPVALFISQGLADEWTQSAIHRRRDKITEIQLAFAADLPTHIRTRMQRRAAHLCENCGQPAQPYSQPDNYSAHCEACNRIACEKRNAASARRRAAP